MPIVHLVHFYTVIVQCAYFVEHFLYVCYPLPQILVSLIKNFLVIGMFRYILQIDWKLIHRV